jgi:hypothetical protein
VTAVADDRTPLDAPPRDVGAPGRPVAVWEWVLLAIVLGGLVWSVAQQLAAGEILGHDEAAYATRARSWLEHSTTTSWFAHRGAGLPVLGVAVLYLGGGAVGLRLVGLAFAIALAVGVWALTRRLGGPVGAPVAAAAVAFSPPLLDHAARFLTDLPAAALVVWLVVVVVREAGRPGGPGAGLLWAAPLAAGAWWLRLGAVLPIGIVAVLAVALWPREVVAAWRWVVATAGLTIGLLWLHFAGAIEAFGTPWGRVLFTSQLTRASEPGTALATYVRDLPAALAGPIVGVLMLVGVVGTGLLLVVRRRWNTAARGLVLVAVTATAHLVAMGVSAEPAVRFVFLTIVLCCALGGVVLDALARLLPAPARPLVAIAATTVVVAVGVGPTTSALVAERHDDDAQFDAMRAAATEILARSAGDCAVMTGYVPQVEWLTGCAARTYGDDPSLERLAPYAGNDRYLLFLRGGKSQPEDDEREALVEKATLVDTWDLAEGRIGRAELYAVP